MDGKGEDKKNSLPGTSLPSSSTQTTLVAQGMFLEGDISGSGDLVIQGRVQGKISLEGHDLTVVRTGRVKADIRAENIIIHGTVEGRIHALGTVTLHADANMSGDIASGRISIAEGAVFKGSLKIQPPG
jgi:cytoskeletal protein CcmA (bactofilin family)